MATEAGWAERTTHSLPKIIHIPCHGHTEPPTQTLNYFATLLQPRTPALLCAENDSAVWRKTRRFSGTVSFLGGGRLLTACIGSALTAQRSHARRTCLGNHQVKACISRVSRSVQQGGNEKEKRGGGALIGQQVRSRGADLSADCYISNGQEMTIQTINNDW